MNALPSPASPPGTAGPTGAETPSPAAGGTELALTAAPEKRRRGRPAGQKMRIAAQQLRHTHFSFLRALMNGIGLRKAWEMSLSFDGGPDDERHFAARARELVTMVRAGAEDRGLQARADVALAGMLDLLPKPAAPTPAREAAPAAATPPAPSLPTAPAIPSLDDWIAQKCEEIGADPEETRYSEWQELYNDEFDLDRPTAPMPATAIAEPPSPASVPAPSTAVTPAAPLPSLNARLDALNHLTTRMSSPPALSDALGVWLSAELAKRLANTQVDGKALPLLTLGNLIAMVNLYHHRWWVHVPRLGADRAARLVAWLTPLAEQLGHPLTEMARKPLSQITRERQSELAVLDAREGGRHTTFGLVPLDRLAVPPDLSGKTGAYRAKGGPNAFEVDDDLTAIFKWLQRERSPRTTASYQLIVERFYLWCLWKKCKALSSLNEQDFRDYRDFLANPPADWVQSRRAGRGTPSWRPFKGPASPESIKLNYTVIASLIAALHDGGYLSVNAIKGAMPSLTKKLLPMNIDRTFNDAQWTWLMSCWKEMYRTCGPRCAEGEEQPLLPDTSNADQQFLRAAGLRRTRLIMELGSTTGLRLLEFVTTRRQALVRQVVGGKSVWMLKVIGKGNKEREVPIYDDIKALLDQHHLDMKRAGTHFDPTSRGFRTLDNPTAKPKPAESPDEANPGGVTDVVVINSPQLPDAPSPSLPGDPQPTGSDSFDESKMPLIGALRRAPRPKVLSPLGLLTEDESASQNTDRYGSLDPNAMYQALRRFLEDCSRRARATGVDIDVDSLERASTHWLRHFFANSAADDGVDLTALRIAMGHASLTTTSVYLRTERTQMVTQLAKMKRRS